MSYWNYDVDDMPLKDINAEIERIQAKGRENMSVNDSRRLQRLTDAKRRITGIRRPNWTL